MRKNSKLSIELEGLVLRINKRLTAHGSKWQVKISQENDAVVIEYGTPAQLDKGLLEQRLAGGLKGKEAILYLRGMDAVIGHLTTWGDLLQPNKLETHAIEGLYNPDVEEDDREVILVEDLTKQQKKYLGLGD